MNALSPMRSAGAGTKRAELVDPAHLAAVARELEIASEGCTIMARRAATRDAECRHLIRASLCRGAAQLLRDIAE